MQQIKNFEDLMKDYIGPNKTRIDTKVTNLLEPGENYMSEMIKIHIILKNNVTGADEDLHLVAKLVTTNNLIGQTTNLNKSEFVFYTQIIPAIHSFQERHGLPVSDFFPKFIAGRINLNGSDIADGDGVIILEDLIEKGYKNADRHIGLNLDEAKLVLKDLATFHAVPLAMKLLEPEIYESKIKSNCRGLLPNVPKDESDGESDASKHTIFPLLTEILESDENNSSVLPYFEMFRKRILDMMKNDPEVLFRRKSGLTFETLIHNDMWINNTMQMFQDGNPIKNIFVDFQLYECNSLIGDLIFFLITSVELKYLQDHFDQLIVLYHEHFSNILKKLRCFCPEYSCDKLLEAMVTQSDLAIVRSAYMMMSVIFAKKGTATDQTHFQWKFEDVPQVARDKISFLFQEAMKRGWLF